MEWLIFLPFIVQMVVIGLDEKLFHVKRDLPKWERIGHPLDTLTVVGCLLFVLLVPYEGAMIKYYVGLAIFSSLFVTKDEFVHKHHCPAAEQWLHAVLFVNHSLVLIAAGLMWPWLKADLYYRPFLWIQVVGASLFCLYQIVYWNFIRRDHVAS